MNNEDKIIKMLSKMQDDMAGLNADMQELKDGQEKIIDHITQLDTKNADRHINIVKEINEMKDNFNDVEKITAKNWHEITKLKSIK